MIYTYTTDDSHWEPTVPGPWTQRSQWCQQYCRERWAYTGKGTFVFWGEQDYIFFLLRWT